MSMTEATLDELQRRKLEREAEIDGMVEAARPKPNFFQAKYGAPEDLPESSMGQAFFASKEDAKIQAKIQLGLDPYQGVDPNTRQAVEDLQQQPPSGMAQSAAALAGRAVGNVQALFTDEQAQATAQQPAAAEPIAAEPQPQPEPQQAPIPAPPPPKPVLQGAPDVAAPQSQGAVDSKVAQENAQYDQFTTLTNKDVADLQQQRAVENTEFQRRFGRPQETYDRVMGSNAGTLTAEETRTDKLGRVLSQQGENRQIEATAAQLREEEALNARRIAQALGEPMPTGQETYGQSGVPVATTYDNSATEAARRADPEGATKTKTRDFVERSTQAFTSSLVSVPRFGADLVDAGRYGASRVYNAFAGANTSPFERNRMALAMEEVQRSIEGALPGDKARAGEFVSQLGSGSGSLAGMMTGSAVLKIAGGSAKLGSMLLGGSQMGEQMADEAVQANAGDAARYLSLIVGFGLGTTEAIPISRALDRAFGFMDTASGGAVMKILKDGTVNSLEEMIQEVGQQIGTNTMAKVIYDNKREIFEGVYDSAKVAAVLGAVFGGGTTALGQLTKGKALTEEEFDRVLNDEIRKAQEQAAFDQQAPAVARGVINDPDSDRHEQAVDVLRESENGNGYIVRFANGEVGGIGSRMVNLTGLDEAAASEPPPEAAPAPVVETTQAPTGAPVSSPAPVALSEAQMPATQAPGKAGGASIATGEAPTPTAATPQAIAKAQDVPVSQVPLYIPDQVPAASPGKSAGLFQFDVTQLNTDAERFQYKAGGDQEGVTNRLKGVKKWDPAKANQLMVWQSKEGQLYVVDGHQRSGLARRLIAEGRETAIQIPGLLFREADGFTPDRMRALAAGKNIAEGSGTILDAAKVLKVDPSLIDESMPVSDYKIRQATDLSKLADEPFRMIVNEVTEQAYGAIVGRLIPEDADLQVAAITALNKIGPANETEAELVVRRVKNSQLAANADAAQGGLFGDALDMPESTVMEEIRVVARAMAELKKDKSMFARVVRNADQIESVGSKINREASSGIVSESDRAMILLETQTDTPGAVRTQLLDLAQGVKSGKTSLADAARKLAESIRKQPAFQVRGELPRLAAMKPAKRAPGQADLFGDFNQGAMIADQEAQGRNKQRVQQLELPGTEQSARQLSAYRENQALGRLRGSKPQAEADQGLFGDPSTEPNLFGMAPANTGTVKPAQGQIVEVQQIGGDDWKRLKDQVKLEQPLPRNFDDVEGVRTQLQAHQDRLVRTVERINDALGISGKARGQVKTVKSISKKRTQKGLKGIFQITDLVGCGFTAETMAQARDIVRLLSAEYGVINEGWDVTDGGYFDLKAMIVFEDGVIGELQIWPPNLLQAKEDGTDFEGQFVVGHELYEQIKELVENGEFTVADRLREKSIRFYSSIVSGLSTDFQEFFRRNINPASAALAPNVDLNAASENGLTSRSGAKNNAPGSTVTQSPSSSSLTARPLPPSSSISAGSASQVQNDNAITEDSTLNNGNVNNGPADLTANPNFQPTNRNPGLRGTGATGQAQFPGQQTRPDVGIPSQPDATMEPGLRLADIVSNVAKRLGLNLQGNVRVSGALGTYNRLTGTIRLRNKNNYVVLSHEAGHKLHLDNRQAIDALIAANALEIQNLSQGVAYNLATQELEGFAEFFRLYMTNRNFLGKRAPGMWLAFENWLIANNPQLLQDITEGHDTYQAYLAQPSSAAIRGDMVSSRRQGKFKKVLSDFGENGLGKTLRGYFDRFYTASMDDLHPVNRSVQELLRLHYENTGKVMDLKVTQDAYKLLRLARNSRTRGMIDITEGVVDYHGADPTGPSLADAIQLALNKSWMGQWSEDEVLGFGAYLGSRRVVEEWIRFQNGELTNEPDKFSLGEHQTHIREYEASHPNAAKAADLVYAFQRNLLRKAFDAGFLTKEQYTDLLAKPNYVPLMRDMSDKRPDGDVSGNASSGLSRSMVQRFKGSQRSIINPLESIMQRAFAVNDMIAKNDAIVALAKLAAMAGPGSGGIAEVVPDFKLQAQNLNVIEALEKLAKEQGLDPVDAKQMLQNVEDFIGADGVTQMFRAQKLNDKQGEAQNIVFFWRDGKRSAIQLTDTEFGREMYNAISGVSRQSSEIIQNVIFGAASTVTRAVSVGVTTTPEFIISNFMVDQAMQMMLYGKVPVVSGLRGLGAEIGQTRTARMRNIGGAVMGGAMTESFTDAAIERNIRALQRRGYNLQRFTGEGGLKELVKLTGITESGSRNDLFRTAFNRAKKQGLSDYEALMEAAFTANDFMDYSRRGSRMLAVNRLVTFLNPSLQGLSVFNRALFVPWLKVLRKMPLSASEKTDLADSAKVWARVAIVSVISGMLYALYADDPEHNEIDENIKATHWVFKIGDTWWRWRKPFEFGIFINLAEAAVDASRGDETWFERWLDSSYEMIQPPMDIPILSLPAELYYNQNNFTNRPIVSEALQGLEPFEQYNANTSEISKGIGRLLNVSPAMVDHLIVGTTSSWGRNFLAITDRMLSNKEFPFETTPFIRRFTVDPSRGGRSQRAFYDLVGQSTGRLALKSTSYNRMLAEAREDEANSYFERARADEKVFVKLNESRGDGKPIFDSEVKRLHPLRRVKDLAAVTRDIVKDAQLGILKGDREKSIVLTPSRQAVVADILSRATMIEMHNTLVLTQTPGWSNRASVDAAVVYEELRVAEPEVYGALESRMAKQKIYSFAGVSQAWGQLQERILTDGDRAKTRDLVSTAKRIKGL